MEINSDSSIGSSNFAFLFEASSSTSFSPRFRLFRTTFEEQHWVVVMINVFSEERTKVWGERNLQVAAWKCD